MKQFDWDGAPLRNSPAMLALLKALHNRPVTEEEFVMLFRKVPRSNGLITRRSPSRGRSMYRNLKKKFGFFNA